MIPPERLQELFGLDLAMLLEGMLVKKGIDWTWERIAAVIIVVLKP